MPPKTRTRVAERAGIALIALPLLAVLALLVGTSGAQSERPDVITSENVKFIKNLPEATDGVGARVVGNRLFVTTTKDLLVYDITDPINPVNIGGINANISFENEEVPTNGKVLGVSGQIGGCAPVGATPVLGTNCLVIYDVSKPTAPKVADVVANAGDHTHTCVLDCKYFYGSEGVIVDATDPYNAKRIVHPEGHPDAGDAVNWQEDLPDLESTHHQNEIRPGILATATQPMFIVSINEADGGSVTKPAVLAKYRHDPSPREDPPYYGENFEPGPPTRRFIHGVRWPNAGSDKFLLAGGETNFQARCHDRVGKFMVFDTTRPSPQGSWTQTDEVWPQQGNYTDGSGRGNTQILGCSAHWFEEHPTFKNGGLVALAEYEQGTRFLQITPEGTIRQLGFALPIAGSTSAPHWAPDGRTVYNIDYTRGLDVLRYEGPLVVPENGQVERPPQQTAPGEKPLPESGAQNLEGDANSNGNGTGNGNGPQTVATPDSCTSREGFSRVSASRDRITVIRRKQRPFTVQLIRQSKGRRVVDRGVGRLRVKGNTVRLPKRAASGFYFARIHMVLPRADDVRRVALRRQGGRWSVRPDHYMRGACGVLNSYKLERPVFGGTRRVPLRFAYRLPIGVDSVRIDIMRGTRVVRTIKGSPVKGAAHRYAVPASVVPAGTDVRVRVTVQRAGARFTTSLVSHRL